MARSRYHQYCAGGKIETNEMGRACSAYGEDRGLQRVLVGKPEGKRPLGRPRRRWEDNIKMELNYLYSLPNIVRVVKSRRMRWAGHVARMGEDRGVQSCWWGNP